MRPLKHKHIQSYIGSEYVKSETGGMYDMKVYSEISTLGSESLGDYLRAKKEKGGKMTEKEVQVFAKQIILALEVSTFIILDW